MRSILRRALLVVTLFLPCLADTGCKADIHDNTVNANANIDFKVDSSVDLNHVRPGQSIPVSMNVSGAVLVDPNTTPKPADVDTAAFFKIFLDDTDSTPIVVTASLHVDVTIPANTSPGDHKLICRLHKHDGTPTDQEQEVDIKVDASATVTTDPDAGMH